MKRLNISIPEKQAMLERLSSSLSKIWQYATQNQFPTGIITAFRGPRQIPELKDKIRALQPRYTKNQNLKRNLDLKQDLESYNLRIISTHGVFLEGQGTPNPVEVAEDSFFVCGVSMSFDQLKEILTILGTKYNQDSILVIDPSTQIAVEVGTQNTNEEGDPVEPGKGTEIPRGKFHPNQIGPFYSKWKHKPFEFRANSTIDSLYGKALANFLSRLANEERMPK